MGRLARGLHSHQLGVRGEVGKRFALKIGQGLEVMFRHEVEQLVAHRFHALVAKLHYPGANRGTARLSCSAGFAILQHVANLPHSLWQILQTLSLSVRMTVAITVGRFAPSEVRGVLKQYNCHPTSEAAIYHLSSTHTTSVVLQIFDLSPKEGL